MCTISGFIMGKTIICSIIRKSVTFLAFQNIQFFKVTLCTLLPFVHNFHEPTIQKKEEA